MQHFIATYGYLAIFVLMLLESACIPIPSELIMTFGGALAAGAVPGTSLNLAGVIIAGVAGNVAGSYLAWAVGRYGGQAALRKWGARLRLRGKGISGGDQFIEIKIVAPAPVNDESKKLIEEFARINPQNPRAGLW